MVAYSPISTHRHRVNTAPSCQIASTSTSNSNAIPTIPTVTAIASGHMAIGCRRRESMNSSIGATSIRRLLTVNRACQNKVPVHVRAKVAKNFTLLIIAHGLTCAVYVPLFGLQVNIFVILSSSYFSSFIFILFSHFPFVCDFPFAGIKFNLVSSRVMATAPDWTECRSIIDWNLFFNHITCMPIYKSNCAKN